MTADAALARVRLESLRSQGGGGLGERVLCRRRGGGEQAVVVDELHHRDTALEYEAEKAPGYRAMKGAIKRGVKTAIWLAERI